MHSFENDSPSPSANLPSSSSSSTSSTTAKEQERMETASTISSCDSGVEANDASDSVIKNSDVKERDEMVVEEEAVTPSNIPMTM